MPLFSRKPVGLFILTYVLTNPEPFFFLPSRKLGLGLCGLVFTMRVAPEEAFSGGFASPAFSPSSE